jgi:phosphoglycolate phosphatase-like HAD superfamily hydrolase
VTSSILGPAPIIDFDGTLARLHVAWDDLRERLDVERIGQLWESANPDAWIMVRDAEVEAAARARPFEPVRAGLERSVVFAVLTSNSEDAVARFLARFGSLESRAAVVVGRETLAGPKRDYEVFSRGFTKCVRATAAARADEHVVYVGDTDWELDFARRLGALAIDARELNASP